MGTEGVAAMAPVTVMDVFAQTCAAHAGDDAFYRQEGETWVATTWGEYNSAVRKVISVSDS